MSMFDSQSASAIFNAGQDIQDTKNKMAQYAIQQAAKYMQNNKPESAIREFKKALGFDPQNETAHTYLGKIYLSQGKNIEAIREFKAVVKLQPLSVNALVDLANGYIQNKQYNESEKALKTASRLDPLNAVPDYTLGHQYVATDRLAEAENLFKKVAKLTPKDANVYYSLGLVHNKQGKYETAALELEKALTLKKDFPAANYELGVAYGKLMEPEKAKKQLALLQKSDTALAEDLQFALNTPKLIAMDTTKSGGFAELLGPGTPLWMLDPTLFIEPNSSKEFKITFQFTNEMDAKSVTSVTNWSISKANSAKAGYYNNTMPITADEVAVAPMPLSVTYNALDRTATISFMLNQNSEGDATIDPSHLVFKFSGKDAAGRSMDTNSDEINGYSLVGF